MTCITLRISRPLAETPVATMMGAAPVRKARLGRMSKVQKQSEGDLQSIFSLTLSAIRVNRSGRKTHVEQVVVDKVSGLLGLDEHKSSRGWHGDQQIVKSLLLGIAFDPDDL